ncbi:MAG TPA: DUF6622 family protein [Ramlibacter sp.]|nr:DUF6622 family protein [Ramlibacter sp.]
MLIQTLIQQPQMLGPILKNTPVWVWGLLAALVALGLQQVRTRQASLLRVGITPLAMTALAIWGNVSGFGASPLFGWVMLAWLAAAATMLAVSAPLPVPSGTVYDPASRSFRLPGSWWPMALIAAIFLTKYLVGVELAMRPALARDSQYALIVGAMYGLFSGAFIGRAARLWRLAYRPAPVNRAAFNA